MSDHRLQQPPRLGPIRRALTDWLYRGPPTFVATLVLWLIRRDATWSAAYDAERQVEAAAAGDALGHLQLEQLEARILDATAAPDAPPARSSRRVWGGLALGGVGLASAAAAVLLWAGPAVEPSPGGPPVWKERGDPELPPIGLQVRCLSAEGDAVLDRAQTGPREPLAGLRCPADGMLSWSVTNLSEEPVHLFVVGLAGDEVRWYAPFHRDDTSVEVAPRERDRLLKVLADTDPFPADEEVALYALFSRSPLSGAQVQSQLDAADRRGRRSAALDRLPVRVSWQARIELMPPAGDDEARR